MNKINLLISSIALLLAVTITVLFFNNKTEKTAYVETNIVIEEFEGMKKAKVEFEDKAKLWQANIDTAVMAFQKELQAYEKERASMSAKERELQEQLLKNKQQQVGKYQEAMQRQASQEEQQMTQNVLNEVNDYMQNYGKEHGYTYIFGANGSGSMVYADKDAKNITQEIIEGLNAAYQK